MDIRPRHTIRTRTSDLMTSPVDGGEAEIETFTCINTNTAAMYAHPPRLRLSREREPPAAHSSNPCK